MRLAESGGRAIAPTGANCADISPTMDVIALSSHSAIETRRTSWQRLWTVSASPPDESQSIRLAWRPDGQAIAATTSRGVSLLSAEDGNEMALCGFLDAIAVAWAGHVSRRLPRTRNAGKLPPDAGKHPCVHSGWCVLAVLTRSLDVKLLPFGTLLAMSVSIKEQLSTLSDEAALNATLRIDQEQHLLSVASFHATDSHKSDFEHSTGDAGRATIASISLPALGGPESDFACSCTCLAICDNLLTASEAAASSAARSWRAVRSNLANRLVQPFERSLHEQAINAGVRDSLVLSLCTGMASEEEQQFLLASLGEAETLKLLSKIDSCAGEAHNALVMRTIGGLEASLLRLGELRGIAKGGEPLLDCDAVERSIVSCTQARLTAQAAAHDISEQRAGMRAFLLWMIRLIKTIELPKGQELPADLPIIGHESLMTALNFVEHSLHNDILSMRLGSCMSKPTLNDNVKSCAEQPEAVHDAALREPLSTALKNLRDGHTRVVSELDRTVQASSSNVHTKHFEAEWIHLSQCNANGSTVVAVMKQMRTGSLVLLTQWGERKLEITMPKGRNAKAAGVSKGTQVLLLLECADKGYTGVGTELSLVECDLVLNESESFQEQAHLADVESQRMHLPLNKPGWLAVSSERDIAVIFGQGRRVVIVDLSEVEEREHIEEEQGQAGSQMNVG